MKTSKAFDCVEMKHRIQRQIADEVRDMPEEEVRRVELERIAEDPVLGACSSERARALRRACQA